MSVQSIEHKLKTSSYVVCHNKANGRVEFLANNKTSQSEKYRKLQNGLRNEISKNGPICRKIKCCSIKSKQPVHARSPQFLYQFTIDSFNRILQQLIIAILFQLYICQISCHLFSLFCQINIDGYIFEHMQLTKLF